MLERVLLALSSYLNASFGFQNDKEDILSRFLMESKKDPTTMTDQYLRDIILNFMIAGKDTSANTLSWFFYMLCKNPLVQEKIAQEVREVISSHENESNIDEYVANLTDVTLDKMHYLHAALTETLRLYPAVPAVPSIDLLKTILNYLFYSLLCIIFILCLLKIII